VALQETVVSPEAPGKRVGAAVMDAERVLQAEVATILHIND
jgi:hypothetical protein